MTSAGALRWPSVAAAPGLLLPVLPPITIVFTNVDAPEVLLRRRRTFAPRVQQLLGCVVRDALRRCGGYLCRVQDGDLRFMCAFASPIAALEWCVLAAGHKTDAPTLHSTLNPLRHPLPSPFCGLEHAHEHERKRQGSSNLPCLLPPTHLTH